MKKPEKIAEPIICVASRLEYIANKFVFNPMGTTSASIKILRLLQKIGPMTPNRILELSSGTKSNISQRLNNLEVKGYIIRDYAVFKDDKRKVVVKPTARGKDLLKQVEKRLKKGHLSLEQRFSKKEIADHQKFFQKIKDILDKEEKNLEKIFNK